MAWSREIFWISAVNNLRVTSRYIKKAENTTAATLSRLHNHLSADNFLSLLHSGSITNNPYCVNLSSTSLSLLPTQVSLKSRPSMKNVYAIEARPLPILREQRTNRQSRHSTKTSYHTFCPQSWLPETRLMRLSGRLAWSPFLVFKES